MGRNKGFVCLRCSTEACGHAVLSAWEVLLDAFASLY